jgi:hypothetical protein
MRSASCPDAKIAGLKIRLLNVVFPARIAINQMGTGRGLANNVHDTAALQIARGANDAE